MLFYAFMGSSVVDDIMGLVAKIGEIKLIKRPTCVQSFAILQNNVIFFATIFIYAYPFFSSLTVASFSININILPT